MKSSEDSLTNGKVNKMKELIMNKYLGFVGILTSLILSITLYAYARDLNNMKENIDDVKQTVYEESIDREKGDITLDIKIEATMSEHEKLHEEQEKNNIMLIKYLDQRFDDMEKLIKH